ncbi:MAG: hypothetical protein M3345_02270 [Actinomycetota bacterium]|nr:hypothetical protein [Actinomycetota bacterium]
MSTAELEQELARARDQRGSPSSAVRLSVEAALAYRDAGNLPDDSGRSLRLVLYVGDRTDLESLGSRRRLFEPDLHDAPVWRRDGSRPVTVVPLRTGVVEPASGMPWWEEPELAQLEDEWRRTGRISGVSVPEAYRGFVYKTVLGLRAAGAEITADSIADSIARWMPLEADTIRAALRAHPSSSG